MIPHKSLQDKIREELSVYMKADGLLGIESAIRARTLRSPVQSLTCSASGCERNWSVYEHIYSKKRNRLEWKRLNDLVFIKYNRTMTRCYNAPPQNHQYEEVYEGESLTYGDVSMESGVEKNIYGFRGSTLRGKERGARGSSASGNLVDDPSDDEEDNDQVEPLVMALEEFEDLVEE
ncbi:hypothetical protein R3W88_033250 [Solanum pinnatisectum]|uniref:HAT C-terminal dimerisation domain-containing protein n=1 Tax=Solanum pinnatisectum TaxID=50273 RepID=A0AAV9K1Q1_9SOLN|nr:hypothetical protein R3W88_033250 [Solanum pinnatisectum]